ncbi:MAG TPA: class I SAM-dependent methyltransferase, partial [Streptosporangiaceae bacterium]|nr:class I SAM-dependent methyltransferase [Streptosporangiaceae bacterium]
MTTDWLDGALAHTFGGLDGLTERTVGYPALFRELGLGGPGVSTLLDYGCGPGWIALEIAERYDVEITAVDIAPEMLRLARARPHPRVRHRLLDASGLDFLAPSSIDAAMCCFVFSNVAELTELRRITDAVGRVLRPGGRYVLMDANPDATGTAFASFRTGEPGRTYEAGEPRRVELYGPGDRPLELVDYHWPEETYRQLLADAGFRGVRALRPRATLAQAERIRAVTRAATVAESTLAPLLLIVAER